MNTKPGATPQIPVPLHSVSTSKAGASAIMLLDALVRQHKATRRTFPDWFDARLTRRR